MQDSTPAEKLRGLQIHALSFVIGLPVMGVVNYFTGPPYWVLWVLLGWGIGLVSHWFFIAGPGAKKA